MRLSIILIIIFFLATPALAGRTFTSEDLKKYAKSPPTKQETTLDDINDICGKIKKPGTLTDYEISTMLRGSEYLIKYLDVSSLKYKLLYECMQVLIIEQDIRKKKHEQIVGPKLDDIIEKYEQDYWCIKGNNYRNQIEKAERWVNEAEQNFRKARRVSSYSMLYAGQRLQRAKDNLLEKEKQLSQLEFRAYRGNIPASWYRCQYE